MSSTRVALIARLLSLRSEAANEAARAIAEMETELVELRALDKAREFELRWLLGHLRNDPVVGEVDREMEAALGGPERDVDPPMKMWIPSQDLKNDEQSYVARGCPRLRSLLKGELPSLKERT